MRRLLPPHIRKLALQGRMRDEVEGATLLIDAEGSTALSSRLEPHGTRGAEAYADILAAIFSPMVERVSREGGSVAEFAGDGLLAVFPGEPADSVHRALRAATGVAEDLSGLSEFETPAGPASLTVRSVIGSGQLKWQIWSNDSGDTAQNAAFASFGPAVEEARRGEKVTPGGVISVGPSAVAWLPPGVEIEALPEGFVAIDSTNAVNPPPPETRLLEAGHASEIPFRFFPEALTTTEMRGEFRDVVSVFVDLRPTDMADAVPMGNVLEALGRRRGYLNHVVRPGDDDLGIRSLLLWGAPTSREHDIGYALRFLSEVRNALGDTEVRAGVTRSTAFTGFIGNALQETYTAMGSGVNLAARLCSAAPWGEIRVDRAITARLTDPWRFEEAGYETYKGFSEPVAAYRLDYIPPVLVGEPVEEAFVGRESELDQLEDLLAPLWFGQPAGIIAVGGDPGIGKSALIAALERRLEAREPPPVWMRAQADEIRSQPLATLKDALARYFGSPGQIGSGEQLDEYLEEVGRGTPERMAELHRTRSALGDLLDLAPDVEKAEQLDPRTRFENLVLAVANLIEAVERTSPVIISIADGQWIDSGTAEVLARLSAQLVDKRVAVIIESRSPGVGIEHDHIVRVGPMTRKQLGALAESILGEPPSDDVLTALAARSGGNPFFAGQLLEYGRRDGAGGTTEILEATGGDVSVPLDLRRILVARLDDLDPPVRRLVQKGSVLGRDFDVELLKDMTRDERFEEHVRAATDAGILRSTEKGGIAFVDLMVRDAAYGMILHSEARSLHAAAAAAMAAGESGKQRLAEIAYHHDRAGNKNDAANYYLKAGKVASGRFDNAEAIALLERALELISSDDHALRYHLLRLEHDVYELTGDRSSQQRTIDAMEQLTGLGPEMSIEIARLRANALQALGRYAEAETVVDEAMGVASALAMDHEQGQLVFLRAHLAREQGRIDEARSLAASSKELFELARDEISVARVDDFLGGIAWETGDFETAAELHRSAAEAFEVAGRVTDEVRALNNLGTAIFSMGDYSAAREIHRAGAERSRAIGYRMGEGDHLDNMGGTAWAVWDLDLAKQLYNEALRIREGMDDAWGIAISKGNLGANERALGNPEEGLTLFREALEIDRRIGRRRGEAYDLHGIGLCHLDMGRNNLAVEALRQASEIRRDIDEPHLANESDVACAVGLLRRGDADGAAELVREILDAEGDSFFAGAMETTATRLRCIEVLAAKSPDLAESMRKRVMEDLGRRASRIGDPEQRRSYIENAEERLNESRFAGPTSEQ